ncbi:hypothetical protein EDB81DRAFT_826621 [Dactylonectria macrodidyma]|uniref:Zn(2)-C6 fungal-type domain-containing protein n=1 Tax=Dactylonectria macrodidyma TaxID=307937 RepID=A0A9P9IAZ3_9HYPO|nr:hypothetical protein EDB81DRAFT_826621 [Dactylonectria macrodidyma]
MPHSPPASGLSYPSTQRDGPPHGIGGYPPPPTAEPPPGTYPPPDQRRGYYRPPGPAYGRGPYPSGPYYAYRGQQPQGPQPPNGFRDYRAHRGPGAAPRPTRAAPGQRTLIACQYCRTRKIRCSGYQSAPEGKCQNCVWKNQPCIFQLVSSTNSTPFVPLPAVPGGVLPGTQLFGAHGQPLAPSSVPAPHPSGPQQRPLPAQLPPLRDHYAPAQTPTEPFSPTEEARADGGSQVSGERRRRTSEEPDEGQNQPSTISWDETEPTQHWWKRTATAGNEVFEPEI